MPNAALSNATALNANDVIAFWLEAGPELWFGGGPGFDARCRAAFLSAWQDARVGRLDRWAETPDGALALVLLLDQMPRNMFRGTADAYATDPAARRTAHRAIERRFDRAFPPELARFFALPFMHSEDPADQALSVFLAEGLGGDAPRWARHHAEIVARFGRFPHRNAILGRLSRPDEHAYLADPDAFRG
ncbi:DUF924 domain-containing protein [Hyphomicrobiaceae bacterium 22]|uniref:DUF924 domain-containing protein n=2 Tax=Prosthecodimorpha staleyi TaxID=2840188 RepID=A0A947G9G9_9HYPH|nr:DUF924 domain-containing protein [Prosthecodimorpha staleyi]